VGRGRALHAHRGRKLQRRYADRDHRADRLHPGRRHDSDHSAAAVGDPGHQPAARRQPGFDGHRNGARPRCDDRPEPRRGTGPGGEAAGRRDRCGYVAERDEPQKQNRRLGLLGRLDGTDRDRRLDQHRDSHGIDGTALARRPLCRSDQCPRFRRRRQRLDRRHRSHPCVVGRLQECHVVR